MTRRTDIKKPSGVRDAFVGHPGSSGYLLLAVALFLAVLCYISTLKYGFVFDDVPQIVENPAIRSWNSFPQYFTANVWAGVYPGFRGSFYRPLFLVWLRANYLMFKLTPWGWHLASLFTHLATVWIFFLFVRECTGDALVAGWASLLFGVHPIHIEAVAWVSAVPELQFSLAGMAALYCFVRYTKQNRRLFFCSIFVFYAIALLAKETALVIWPLIASCDRLLAAKKGSAATPRDRIVVIREQVTFATITATYFGLRHHALQGFTGNLTHSFSELLRIAPGVICFYIEKLIAPFGLSEMYFGNENVPFSSARFFVPLIVLIAVSVSLICWGRKSKIAAFAALLLGLSLVPPLIGICVFPRHELVHNRYAYFPSAGACILFALGLKRLSQMVQQTRWRAARWFPACMAGCISLSFAISVRAQERPYRDNLALFSSAVQISPKSAVAWGLLGEEQMTVGNYGDGIASFQRAQQLEPAVLLHNYRLGAAYYLVQDMPLAEVFFQRSVGVYRDGDPVTYDYLLYRLGLSQYAQGKMPEAENTFRRAIQIQPKGVGYHLALGATLKYQGKAEEAKEQFETELRLGPDGQATTLLHQVERQMVSARQ
jgi:protein O-mannosyl-transferase